jgi:ribosomal protein S18 acetylase RimI-like enzyme
MVPYLLLLQYLLYMDPAIGLTFDAATNHCFLFTSGSIIRSCNRVCHNGRPTDAEIASIRSFFDQIPFTWVFEAADHESRMLLENHGLHHKASYPGMLRMLDDLPLCFFNEAIVIKELDVNSADVEHWIMVVAQSFKIPHLELSKVINVLKQKIPHALKLYLGFYQENPAAAAMIIQHHDIISMHWIGTIPEFRNKGLGYAITLAALHDAKNAGCIQAVLMASPAGKPIYERLGFKEYTLYTIYGN